MKNSKRLTGSGQVKFGALISYVLIIVNTLYGVFVTPYLIGTLGDAEYGVYKTIASLTASLMVLDLGIGGTVMRFVSKYRASKEESKIPNFVAMMLIQAGVLGVLLLAVGGGMFVGIRPMYAKTFTDAQIRKAQSLFVVLLLNMILHVFQNVLNGVITGWNRMAFGNGIKLTRLLVRIALVLILLHFIPDALTIVLVDFSMTVLFMAIEIWYLRFKLGLKVKLDRWDRFLFMESGKYTFLMFLTSVAAQVNNNLDNVLIGALSGAEYVTVYSIGLTLFGMYEQLSTSISGVMLPTVTNLLEQEKGMEKVQNLVIRVGRVQFALLSAVIVGFACVGKDFLYLWLGDGFEDVYGIALILMIPSLFELCVNVCLSVLRAKNMLGFRTGVLFGSTALNAVVTVIAVSCWSYVGAAFGTAASFIIGSLIIMNIYYYKKLKLPMLKIYAKIMDRIWLCLAAAGGALFVSSRFLYGSLGALLVNILIFCVVYGAALLFFGFDREERKHIPVLNRLLNGRS